VLDEVCVDIDLWQVMGSIAATAFTLGFIDQLRLTLKTRKVDGVSILQWVVFSLASLMFTMYYIHLEQWLMATVSLFGTLCCLTMVGLVFYYGKLVSR